MARTTREESRQVRDAIITATVREIARCGFQGLRIPEVAKAIGKTQGAVYGRFPDKEALAMEALKYIRDKKFLPLIESAASVKDPVKRVARLSEGVAKLARDYPDAQLMLARLVAELAEDKGPLGEEVRAMFDVFMNIVEAILSGSAPGVVRSTVEPSSAAMAFVGAKLGVALITALYAERTSYAKIEEHLRPILLQGLFNVSEAR